jgi:hypothetical protein
VPKRRQPFAHALDEFIVRALLHEQSAAIARTPAARQKRRRDHAFQRLVERRVVVHEGVRRSGQLQREPLVRACEGARELLSDLGGTTEGELVDIGVIG